MSSFNIGSLSAMRHYFDSGATRPYSFRKEQLQKLKTAILRYESQLYDALFADLKKSPEECWVTELGLVVSELNFIEKNLRSWMEPEKAATNLVNLPSKYKMYSGGKHSSIIFLIIIDVAGANSLGFNTAQLPAAIAPNNGFINS